MLTLNSPVRAPVKENSETMPMLGLIVFQTVQLLIPHIEVVSNGCFYFLTASIFTHCLLIRDDRDQKMGIILTACVYHVLSTVDRGGVFLAVAALGVRVDIAPLYGQS